MIGCTYALYLLVTFLSAEYSAVYGGMPWYGYLYHFFLPVTVFQWMGGFISIHETSYVLLGYLMLASGAGAAVAFNVEMFLICRGITAYEMKLGSLFSGKFRMSENLRGVFGNYWLLNFAIPLPCIKPKGNGIDWYTSTKYI